MGDAQHTPGPLKAARSKHPDNTGGYDLAVSDSENRIVAEFYEHVAHDGKGGYVTLPARENAHLYIAAPDLLAVLAPFIEIWARGGHDYKQRMDDYWGYDNLSKARAAIAKATGAA